MLMAILQQLIKALFMIVCSIVSRQPVANHLPTYFQSVGNQSPTSRRPMADWSPILGIVAADQSPIDLQPKNAVFDRTVVALVAAVF